MSSSYSFKYLSALLTQETSLRILRFTISSQAPRPVKYKVFASTPYDSTHILYHYDRFKDTGKVDEFLESVYASREFSVNISDDKADGNDKILVLSTCLKGNYSKRVIIDISINKKNISYQKEN